jgi:hypothetical protein
MLAALFSYEILASHGIFFGFDAIFIDLKIVSDFLSHDFHSIVNFLTKQNANGMSRCGVCDKE